MNRKISNVIAVLGSIGFISIVAIIFWQAGNFKATIDEIKELNPTQVEGIKVIIGNKTIYVSDSTAVSEFLSLVSNIRTSQWGKTNDESKSIDFIVEPQGIAILGHIRSLDSEHIYGHFGIRHGNSFTSYGSIKSHSLRKWASKYANAG